MYFFREEGEPPNFFRDEGELPYFFIAEGGLAYFSEWVSRSYCLMEGEFTYFRVDDRCS